MKLEKFKLLVFIVCSLVCLQNIFAQKHFPEKCEGIWQGTMYMYNRGVIRDSVDIKFTVKAAEEKNSWIWKTEYLSEKMAMTKDYLIKVDKETPNRYILDEKNNIELYDYLFGNKLYSVFETQNILLTATYELAGENLIFEVTSGRKIKSDQKEVINYSVLNVQRVVLTKAH
ncbi:MAG: hypothetical protein ACEPO8_15935 [Rhodothermaceae bacterium]